MGVADSIIARRQFEKIVSVFNNPTVESTTVYHDIANQECLHMLQQEGFRVEEGQCGAYYISLPKPGGFWQDR